LHDVSSWLKLKLAQGSNAPKGSKGNKMASEYMPECLKEAMKSSDTNELLKKREFNKNAFFSALKVEIEKNVGIR
jgi:hypothetical protein